MSRFLLQKTLSEHHLHPLGEKIPVDEIDFEKHILFQGKNDCKCYEVKENQGERSITTSYYIGVDWLIQKELAIQIEPKIDGVIFKTDYLKMLDTALKIPGINKYLDNLYQIKFDLPSIKIKQSDDYLTPLLVTQYISILKDIVKKGLKKSYYKIEENLQGKIKGKILVGESIKRNHFLNKPTKTYCRFEIFGVNNTENKILKKALDFGLKYLNSYKIGIDAEKINYIQPAFESVSSDVSLNDLKHSKSNVFYKEYESGLKIARLILKRFGYNINSINNENLVKTPPFWIDMSMLFELYSFQMLKSRFKEEIIYQFKAGYGSPDFLIPSIKAIVDAKYKVRYSKFENGLSPNGEVIDDIRQLSGYSRDKKIQELLVPDNNTLIDCYIIYPNLETGNQDLNEVDLQRYSISNFPGFYVIGINIPMQNLS